MAMAVAVDQHRFWVSALKVLPFLTSMSTATRVVPLGCWFILIPMLPVFGTDREIRARFDRQAIATKQRPLPWSLPILMRKTVYVLCLVPPKSHAGMGLVPRFDRARNPYAGFITSVIGCLTRASLGGSLSVPCAP